MGLGDFSSFSGTFKGKVGRRGLLNPAAIFSDDEIELMKYYVCSDITYPINYYRACELFDIHSLGFEQYCFDVCSVFVMHSLAPHKTSLIILSLNEVARLLLSHVFDQAYI